MGFTLNVFDDSKAQADALIAFALYLNGLTFGAAKYCLTRDIFADEDRPLKSLISTGAAFCHGGDEKPLEVECYADVCKHA
jgi:hypothetical protein